MVGMAKPEAREEDVVFGKAFAEDRDRSRALRHSRDAGVSTRSDGV